VVWLSAPVHSRGCQRGCQETACAYGAPLRLRRRGAGSAPTSRTRSTVDSLEASRWSNDANPVWSIALLLFEGSA